MDKKLVSVCIPTYNNEDVIERTINSILGQTYSRIEIIISDDCSQDATVSLIRKLGDERIKLSINQHNLGMSGNWNHVVGLAQGEYIKFICADDILEPNCIEKEITLFEENTTLALTINDSKLINERDEVVGIFPRYYRKGIMDGRTLARKALIISNYFGMPSAVMFRKSTFLKVGGFDSAFEYILDYDIWIKMAGEGDVYVMPEKLNYFRLRKNSNTGHIFRKGSNKYYLEHKHLVYKYRCEYRLNLIEIWISLVSRKIRNLGYGIFLRRVIK